MAVKEPYLWMDFPVILTQEGEDSALTCRCGVSREEYDLLRAAAKKSAALRDAPELRGLRGRIETIVIYENAMYEEPWMDRPSNVEVFVPRALRRGEDPAAGRE